MKNIHSRQNFLEQKLEQKLNEGLFNWIKNIYNKIKGGKEIQVPVERACLINRHNCKNK